MAGTSPSDDEALFLTPPTTAKLDSATDEPRIEASEMAASTAIDDALGKSGVLFSPLQELETNDSDMSDSDDEPLGGRLPHSNKMDPPFPDTNNKPSEDYLDSSQPPHSPVAITSDTLVSPGAITPSAKKSPPVSRKSSPSRSRSPGGAFSMRAPSPQSGAGIMDPFGPSNFSTPLEPLANGTPPPIIETVLEPAALPPNASTISDFDEAFGKFPNSAPDAVSTFKFGSTFDDNFDFASAVGVSDQSVEPVGNIHSAETEDVGFSTAHSTDQRKSADHSNGNLTVTFDDAFGLNPKNSIGVQQIEKDVTSSTFNTVQIPAASNMNMNSLPVVQAESQANHSTSPRPATPVERPVSPPIRPMSPQQSYVTIGTSRTASPPPRVSSPRLRGNSKGSSSDNKQEPSKHKLSLRFPFGRKDKSKDKEEKSKDKEDRRGQSHTQQIPPDTSHFLAPISDTIPGAVTPAVEDDAEPVKQLAAMGFSRTQSIAALETHGYDVQAALNSLLGAA